MKTLLLMRHGEAAPHADDRLRPLTRTGRSDTARLGGVLRQRKLAPDEILCSPARRAADSAESVVGGIGSKIDITEAEALYLASAQTVLASIRGARAATRTLMIVGHNPGFQDIAGQLAGAGDAAALLGIPLAAGALVVIDFPDAEWRTVAPGDGTLKAILAPPDYG